MARMNGAEPSGRRTLLEAEKLAWVVLRVANRTQAKGSTARLVVLRAPEVAFAVGADALGDELCRAAEDYLVEQG